MTIAVRLAIICAVLVVGCDAVYDNPLECSRACEKGKSAMLAWERGRCICWASTDGGARLKRPPSGRPGATSAHRPTARIVAKSQPNR